MGDHYWPAMYPGLIVGAIYGLSVGGLWATVIGGIAGLAGAMLSYLITSALGIETGLVTLISHAATAFAVAYVTLWVLGRLMPGLARRGAG